MADNVRVPIGIRGNVAIALIFGNGPTDHDRLRLQILKVSMVTFVTVRKLAARIFVQFIHRAAD